MATVLSFPTEEAAEAAQAQVATNMGLPRVGVNAATGQPQPNATRTTAWASVQKKHEEDKWYFTKPPESALSGISGYTEEETDESWHPPMDEDMKP